MIAIAFFSRVANEIGSTTIAKIEKNLAGSRIVVSNIISAGVTPISSLIDVRKPSKTKVNIPSDDQYYDILSQL